MEPEILQSLISKASLVKGFDTAYYILFSKSGFSASLADVIPENTLLITLDDMYTYY